MKSKKKSKEALYPSLDEANLFYLPFFTSISDSIKTANPNIL